jgi:D-glycero-D-manno-heptose 1,7-bisphosphate phosphatase
MLLHAGEDFNIDFKNSWMIGDSERDILAGKNADCKTILICDRINYGADFNDVSLGNAVERILNDNNKNTF